MKSKICDMADKKFSFCDKIQSAVSKKCYSLFTSNKIQLTFNYENGQKLLFNLLNYVLYVKFSNTDIKISLLIIL